MKEASKTTGGLEEEDNHKNTVYRNPTEQDKVHKTKKIAINDQAIDDLEKCRKCNGFIWNLLNLMHDDGFSIFISHK